MSVKGCLHQSSEEFVAHDFVRPFHDLQESRSRDIYLNYLVEELNGRYPNFIIYYPVNE